MTHSVNTIGYPVIKLGKGLVIVGEGHYDELPALVLSLNGPGVVGEPVTGPYKVLPEETLAVITFDNIESLDVVIDVATRLRAKMALATTDVMPPINQV